jgi:hypothetical protein
MASVTLTPLSNVQAYSYMAGTWQSAYPDSLTIDNLSQSHYDMPFINLKYQDCMALSGAIFSILMLFPIAFHLFKTTMPQYSYNKCGNFIVFKRLFIMEN